MISNISFLLFEKSCFNNMIQKYDREKLQDLLVLSWKDWKWCYRYMYISTQFKLNFHIRNQIESLHKKWSIPLRIFSVNVIKFSGNCGFSQIYWRNPWWKTSFFVQWTFYIGIWPIIKQYKDQAISCYWFLSIPPENIRYSDVPDVFMGHRKRTVAWN